MTLSNETYHFKLKRRIFSKFHMMPTCKKIAKPPIAKSQTVLGVFAIKYLKYESSPEDSSKKYSLLHYLILLLWSPVYVQ